MVDSNVAKDPKKPRPYLAEWPQKKEEEHPGYGHAMHWFNEMRKKDGESMCSRVLNHLISQIEFHNDPHLTMILTNKIRFEMSEATEPAGKPTGDEWQKRGGQLMYTDNP